MTVTKGIEFDPGFAPYILAFQGSIEYLYKDITKFKNLSQKQMKFRQYYKKILELFYNNIGFYVGCLMWASYIKTLPQDEIIGNHCFGMKYNEEENKLETEFLLKFTDSFKKDMKYYLGQDFDFNKKTIELLKTYEEFVLLNKGFTEIKYNTEILLPDNINIKDALSYKEIIDNIIAQKDLSKLTEFLALILKES